MKELVILTKKKKVVKEDILTKVHAKQEVVEQGTKKGKVSYEMASRKDSEIMERKSIIARLNKVSSPDGDYLVIYRANGNFRAFNYLLEIVTWRLYEAYGVYILELKDGKVIHMLVEIRYHLSKDLMQRMLDFGLEVEIESQNWLESISKAPVTDFSNPFIVDIYQTIEGFLTSTLLHGFKSWLVLSQTALSTTNSNLLIADSLLKTIWFINAPCYGNEALASPKANELTIPEQTATGKGKSNPFMADVAVEDVLQKDSKRCQRLLKIKIKI
ncbi:hypothetical protein Tco_0655790 [Tanacetum coccineum]|uniref:Uncharacterized protein n=1 Tax=Tanacetum coccineum TaxID=301880 RepID=A0ABQ4X865_9ASTR